MCECKVCSCLCLLCLYYPSLCGFIFCLINCCQKKTPKKQKNQEIEFKNSCIIVFITRHNDFSGLYIVQFNSLPGCIVHFRSFPKIGFLYPLPPFERKWHILHLSVVLRCILTTKITSFTNNMKLTIKSCILCQKHVSFPLGFAFVLIGRKFQG